jgi:electron transport complex protein RnfD
MTLPPWAPWWIGVVGAFIAIVVGKQVFGGIGQNLFNPAMVARVALLISFPLEMTRWVARSPCSPRCAGLPGGAGHHLRRLPDGLTFDAMTGASILGQCAPSWAGRACREILPEVFDPDAGLLGQIPGSLGETSALLLPSAGCS